MGNISNIKKICDKCFEAFELPWDTEYFGIRSGRAILKETISLDSRKKLKDFLDSFEFVTITNYNNNPQNNLWIGLEIKAFLSDMNIQFMKKIIHNSKDVDDAVYVCEAYEHNERVLEITRTAFNYSRFFNDPWLPVDKAKYIYVHWVESAFDQTDRYFTLAERDGEIAGFLLFSMNNEHSVAIIELIAVDKKYQGQNIGRSLIAGLEKFLYTRGIKSIKVGTQVENVAAIRFYTSCGFKYVSCNSIYHYWPNK